jgi:hypothetical protein
MYTVTIQDRNTDDGNLVCLATTSFLILKDAEDFCRSWSSYYTYVPYKSESILFDYELQKFYIYRDGSVNTEYPMP